MESKWRINVPRLGFVANGKTLAARLLSGGEGYAYVVRLAGIRTAYWLATPLSFAGHWAWQFTIKPTNGKNFPYGHDVEVDVAAVDWWNEGDT